MDRLKKRIADLVGELLAAQACELADVVVSRYKNKATVRVFVYARGGVSLDRCAHLSSTIGDIIDGTDLFQDGYTLEVSSPGLDRPLTTAQDYSYRVGETIRVGFTDPSRKNITAQIVEASTDSVLMRNEDGEFRVGLDEIEMARIVY